MSVQAGGVDTHQHRDAVACPRGDLGRVDTGAEPRGNGGVAQVVGPSGERRRGLLRRECLVARSSPDPVEIVLMLAGFCHGSTGAVHDRVDADPHRDRGAGLLPPQTRRREDLARSDALPQTPTVRPRLPSHAPRRPTACTEQRIGGGCAGGGCGQRKRGGSLPDSNMRGTASSFNVVLFGTASAPRPPQRRLPPGPEIRAWNIGAHRRSDHGPLLLDMSLPSYAGPVAPARDQVRPVLMLFWPPSTASDRSTAMRSLASRRRRQRRRDRARPRRWTRRRHAPAAAGTSSISMYRVGAVQLAASTGASWTSSVGAVRQNRRRAGR